MLKSNSSLLQSDSKKYGKYFPKGFFSNEDEWQLGCLSDTSSKAGFIGKTSYFTLILCINYTVEINMKLS